MAWFGESFRHRLSALGQKSGTHAIKRSTGNNFQNALHEQRINRDSVKMNTGKEIEPESPKNIKMANIEMELEALQETHSDISNMIQNKRVAGEKYDHLTKIQNQIADEIEIKKREISEMNGVKENQKGLM